MSAKRVVILDGCGLPDRDLAPVLEVLLDVLRLEGSQIETFRLREMKIAHCLGCFGCWLKTPGMCVDDDTGRQIAKAVIQSDVTVLFTPVTFGGYSPDLKKLVDHFIQLTSPYFQMDHGEVHHPPRYTRRPRLVTIGVQRHPNLHEAHIFRTLAGRNAINFHPPSYAADVVPATEEPESLRGWFQALLDRSDALPFGEAAARLMPAPQLSEGIDPGQTRQALLLVGSPKTSSPSASAILGSYLLERLGGHGWVTDSLTLRPGLMREDGECSLVASTDRAGLILLVFPLYVDSLPYLVTKALTVIAAHRQAAATQPPQQLVVVVNSGFPETLQNSVALAICREFAVQTGIAWAGGLALGGGGVIGTQPLGMAKRPGLPVGHITRSLDLTAAALSEGQPVPVEAAGLMAKTPFPPMPFPLWRWVYIHVGGKGFEQEAAKNGVAKNRLLDQPYAA